MIERSRAAEPFRRIVALPPTLEELLAAELQAIDGNFRNFPQVMAAAISERQPVAQIPSWQEQLQLELQVADSRLRWEFLLQPMAAAVLKR